MRIASRSQISRIIVVRTTHELNAGELETYSSRLGNYSGIERRERDATLTQAARQAPQQEWPFAPARFPNYSCAYRRYSPTPFKPDVPLGCSHAGTYAHTYTRAREGSHELRRLGTDVSVDDDVVVVVATLARRVYVHTYVPTYAATAHRSPGSATSRHLGINAVISSARGNSSVDVFHRVSYGVNGRTKGLSPCCCALAPLALADRKA